MNDPSFLVRKQKQRLFPDFNKVSLPGTGQKVNRATRHTATLRSNAQCLFNVADHSKLPSRLMK